MGSSASRVGSAQQERVGLLIPSLLQKKIQEQKTEIYKLERELQRKDEEIKTLKDALNSVQRQTSINNPDISELQFMNNITKPSIPIPSNLPKIGDHVVSMWGSSKWQYFTATIQSFDRNSLKYTIEWDDHDPTGRVVDYFNLALDKVPLVDQIGVGSKVLFHQGEYKQQEVQGTTRSGGLRWHEGEITKITRDIDGIKRYQGKHTKGEEDGKWITYKDYSREFIDFVIEDFRLPPNVFDILSSVSEEEDPTEEDTIDVFISYAKINCPSAIRNREVPISDLPPSYEEAVLQDMCDPRDIVKKLTDMGVRVFFMEEDKESSLLEIVTALKKTKVFIACLSDEYASNDRCRMEFQYAKKTVKIPVIPIVVGTGSFQWKMTVVGLLIAGELYIHFKDKTVQGFKMNELLRSIKRYIPDIKLDKVNLSATGNASLDLITTPGLTVTGVPMQTGQADVFFSYCWTNSYSAFGSHQISKLYGNKWNDPRLIKTKLGNQLNVSTWIDVERLESAADGMGMFSQIATALGECKVVVAFISDEYAESDNCRMELQFSLNSLQKPAVIVVVGEGKAWEKTVVGQLVSTVTATVDLQSLSSEAELDERVKEMKQFIHNCLTKSEDDVPVPHRKKTGVFASVVKKKMKKRISGIESPSKHAFKAPRIGDHVVCLHQKWAYFTATVVAFDSTDLIYTVDWDDGDPSGRVQSYKDLALNVVPDVSEIGVGSVVIFPQGSYAGTEGNNTGGKRYHQGKITSIYEDADGIKRYSGKHTRGEEDGKWTTYGMFNPTFENLVLDDLRIAPNAMDALMACREAFNITS